ncbi:serine/threonine-protein kinase MPS1-like isoform X2 [Phragmites australis]|uniref:serine/threonine-protein kinase MPS1-like isoform X2 n=1 Tax=Phragmites australis TaxID=29695 RepID=UPI002D776700|nr:serine/threonine-protein kinase MPS1-like isoform X2 [Phragmites australis]
MESRDNFLRPPTPSSAAGASAGKGLTIPTAGDTAATNLTSSSGSSSSLTLSPPALGFLHQVHAAVKRQRPHGSMQSNVPRATRVLVSRGEGANKAGASPSVSQNSEGKVMQPQRGLLGPSRLQNVVSDQKKVASAVTLGPSCPDELMLTTPSTLGNITDTHNQSVGQKYQQKSEVNLLADRGKSSLEVSSSRMASRDALVGESFKKEPFYSVGDPQSTSRSENVGVTVDSRMDSMSSYLHSVSLTARDNFPVNQGEHAHRVNHQEVENADAAVNIDIMYTAANLSRRGVEEACNQNHGEPMTRCSAIGSSITAVSLHSGPTVQSTQDPQVSRYALPAQMPESAVEPSGGVLGHGPKKQHTAATGVGDWNPHDQQDHNLGNVAADKAVSDIGSRLPSEGLSSNNQSTSARDGGASRPNKGEKERHKRNYDPNVFFKVNGKLYQKLGKIGSGGSSEVHKVISAECIIFALKKIKLRGRDYPTAYGFCQEIEYLNKLKGKSNIIQLIDYEVTDKSLLLEGSMSPRKDGKIKDDHYIYMVLEYGEIDLAHMVAQKWKERNNSNMKIDENWLRFYWQQMLEAVNTIHEERIVHSDLKPANFMLVGTLNYMSPEAFMCNDQDSGGNIIKCGRPSDIWSLGCILYQMVYGKTPFADYKTFWAKYKEVTDRNHKIKYEPVDNPWLIDLMQRCLAWDRDERWRIPQLLQHPFLNPPVPRDLAPIDHDRCRLLMEKIRAHWTNPVVSKLCSIIENLEEDQC